MKKPDLHRLPELPRLRAVTVRRSLALLLLAAAAALLVTGRAGERTESVVVAARELRPGTALTGDDVHMTPVPAGTAPPGALRSAAAAVGQRVAGTLAPGEPLTVTRMLSSRLPSALTGDPSARLVPVRTADPAVAGLLRAGDVVDVLDGDARVLAAHAVVALPAAAPAESRGVGGSSAPVLLAIPARPAQLVAGAGLSTALTLVLH
ncbi:MAG: SAF domain-containing protein [Gordonia sp. (in: high G+C Gram-positive bacteria)]|uniref:SAF domain-containing protein n=1 Tax=Gordonia sp. (in: high G+C Gram-positive bacteria) TaxID=84139 RepID=UPI0039E69B8F